MSRLREKGARVKGWGVAASRTGGRVLHAVGKNGPICARVAAVQIVVVFFGVERVCAACARRPGVVRALYDLASRAATSPSSRQVDSTCSPKHSETRSASSSSSSSPAPAADNHDSSRKQASVESKLAIAAAQSRETFRNNRRGRHRSYEDMYTGAHAQSRAVRCEICEEAHEWIALELLAKKGWHFRIVGLPPRVRWRCPTHPHFTLGPSVDGSNGQVRR